MLEWLQSIPWWQSQGAILLTYFVLGVMTYGREHVRRFRAEFDREVTAQVERYPNDFHHANGDYWANTITVYSYTNEDELLEALNTL